MHCSNLEFPSRDTILSIASLRLVLHHLSHSLFLRRATRRVEQKGRGRLTLRRHQSLPRSLIGAIDHLQVSGKRSALHTHRSEPQRNMAEEKQSRFLNLPLEIRNLIYNYSVVSPIPIRPYLSIQSPEEHSNPINTGLLAANQQINQESTAVFNSKNVGVILNKRHFNRHFWFMRNCYTSPLIATDQERQSLIDIRRFKEHKFWNMISPLHHVRISLDWIDARPLEGDLLQRAVWLCCGVIMIIMLQPFRDLIIKGEVNRLDTVVVSIR